MQTQINRFAFERDEAPGESFRLQNRRRRGANIYYKYAFAHVIADDSQLANSQFAARVNIYEARRQLEIINFRGFVSRLPFKRTCRKKMRRALGAREAAVLRFSPDEPQKYARNRI